MAKISDLKKVELLEEAVLNNDVEGVKAQFEEFGSFEFTARSLGMALRFCGPEMTRTLIDNGAVFKYEMSAAFKRKYNCAIPINNDEDIPIEYSCWILPAYKVDGYDREIVSDEERKEEVRILHEKSDCNLQDLLYYSIFYDDAPVFETLKELGVNRLSPYYADIVSGKIAMNNMFSFQRSVRRQFQDYMLGLFWDCKDTEERTVRKLKNLLDCLDEEKILLFPADFYDSFKKKFYKKYCSEAMFDFFIRNTNMAERVKKWDIIYALVDMNNASGIQYILSENWISKPKDLNTLLSYAQEKKGIKPEIIAAILDKQNAAVPEKRKKKAKEELTLDAKEPSAAEIKKTWGFKKQDDGTVIITSYKGTATDVVIPSMIGKDPVTAIDSNTFRINAPRLTPAQKKSRQQIVSVEIPGTVKEIPKNVFGYGDNYRGNGHEALERIILDDGIITICEHAFSGCIGLTSVTIPSSITNIGLYPFEGCRKLKEVIIPETMTELPAGFFGYSGISEYTVPENIKTLGRSVFNGCGLLENVTLPDTLEEIPDSTFDGCGKLRETNLPEGLNSIGKRAFANSGLTGIAIPDTVKKIGESAFFGCKDLAELDLPKDVEIGQYAFSGCNALANDDGQIIVRGRFFGVISSGWKLTPDEELKPLKVAKDTDMSDAVKDQFPIIVYRECENKGKTTQGELIPGNTVVFGMFPQETDYTMRPLEWRVLAVEDGKALLLTEKAIISIPNSVQQEGVWADCYVRRLLNEAFIETAFSDEEKDRIIKVLNVTADNKARKAVGGPDTEDCVFLLSLEETEMYLPDKKDRECILTEYAHHQRTAKYDGGYWLLRTPGKDMWGSAAVSGSNIDLSGNHVGRSCLRPAVWVKTD